MLFMKNQIFQQKILSKQKIEGKQRIVDLNNEIVNLNKQLSFYNDKIGKKSSLNMFIQMILKIEKWYYFCEDYVSRQCVESFLSDKIMKSITNDGIAQIYP